MDDMNAFERQVAFEVLRGAAPPRPVDVAAVFAAIPTATRSPRWRFQSMFSATKFIVAGAIVALFGGFLLAGVLTQPSEERMPAAVTGSPDPTDLLPGVDLLTEEVEPGVYRVLSDGTDHDLAGIGRECFNSDGLAIAPDGTVWLHTNPASRDPGASELIRLGDPDAHPMPWQGWWSLNLGPDGAPWADDGFGMIHRLGSEGWSKVTETGGMAIAADGTIDVVPSEVLERLREYRSDVWFDWNTAFVVAADGAVWAPLTIRGTSPANVILLRFDGESWSLVDPLGVGAYTDLLPHVGADGTVWVNLETEYADIAYDPGHRYLATYGDDGWMVFPTEDGFRLFTAGDNFGLLRVDHSGAVWVRTMDADGVRVFDGQTWRRYLEAHGGVCDMEVAPDGRVWVTSDDLYIIDPETAAATE
jgi:hypothetical protein